MTWCGSSSIENKVKNFNLGLLDTRKQLQRPGLFCLSYYTLPAFQLSHPDDYNINVDFAWLVTGPRLFCLSMKDHSRRDSDSSTGFIITTYLS